MLGNRDCQALCQHMEGAMSVRRSHGDHEYLDGSSEDHEDLAA